MLTEPMSGQREMVTCCAKNCPNISCPPLGTSNRTLLHSFPQCGSSRYKLWMGMVGVSPLPAAPKLCSLHFTSHQYKRTGIGLSSLHTPMNEDHRKPKKLKKSAFPSLFYDSDGELFEMVPVTIPEFSDEDHDEEATLNSVLGDLQSVCSEGQINSLDSETFSTASNKAETEKHCAYHLHCNGVTQSGGQGHASVDNRTDKTDVAANESLFAHHFVGGKSGVMVSLPGSRRIGKGSHGCNFCGAFFRCHLNLGSHLRVHRTLPLKCRSCELQLPNHWKLNQHLKGHGKGFPKSKVCITTSVKSQELQPGTTALLECKDCGKRFESQFWLAMHSQVHSPSWQKAQEKAVLRRKESSEMSISSQPMTTILQGSFSVLTQSPLFHSGEVLGQANPSKAKKSQFFAKNSPTANSLGYISILPRKGLEVDSSRTTHLQDYTLNLPVKSLASNSFNAEPSTFPAMESRPETLKICLSAPCNNTRTPDISNMGFVKKAYLCQQNTNTARASAKKHMEKLESHTDEAVLPKGQGHFESLRRALPTPNKPRVHPPNPPLFSLEARHCSDCGGRFTWPHSLALHRRKKHRRWPSSKHTCQCGRLFGSRLDLLHHELGHVRSGCYICCLCGVSFKRSARLVSHWQRHRGNRPLLKCICGLTFKRIGNLVWHLLKNKL